VSRRSSHAAAAPGDGVRHVACDLLEADQAARVIESAAPDVVFHTQALSDVDQCEREPAQAKAQNVQALAHLLDALRARHARMVYVSTDYVFDGAKGCAYDEADEPKPISVYGRTKWEAEQLVLQFPGGFVVRPSTLFGPGRMNFCDHIVTRLRDGQFVEAFSDQTTSPTYTEDLAEGLAGLMDALERPLPTRVLHLTNRGRCTRAEFAHRIADALGAPQELIKDIRMAEQHRPAPRPANSSLTSRYVREVLGGPLRSWDEALAAYLRQGVAHGSAST